MASKLPRRLIAICTTLAAVGGCGQILGISDYGIDPKLDGSGTAGGEGGTGNHTGNAGKANNAGSKNEAGQPSGGRASGEGGNGGEPTVNGGAGAATSGAGGAAGAGGEGGSGQPPRELVPCDSVACCTLAGGKAEGVELLKTMTLPQTPYYGDFELGTVADAKTPWVEDSAKGYPIITDGTDAAPHKGLYFAWLCGITKETSLLTSEAIDVPADAGWFQLTGYRKFQIDSAADDTLNTDSMSIALWDATDPLEIPFYWDQSDPGDTAGWVKFDASWDAAPHVGKVRYLEALGQTDAHVTDTAITSSNYMLDDISLKIFRCYR